MVVLPASVPIHPHPTVCLQHGDKVIPSKHNQVTTDSEMAPTSHREQTQPPQSSSGFVDAPLSWGSAVPLSYSPQPPGFPAALDHTRPSLPPAFASLLPASAKFPVRLWPVHCLFPVLALTLPWPRASPYLTHHCCSCTFLFPFLALYSDLEGLSTPVPVLV